VFVGATHPIFSGKAIEILQESRAAEIVVADTLTINKPFDSSRIKVVSIASLLAKTIKKVYDCKSVSELFKGENLV
jgi:ribose-phosphate pyrophosphokinase